MGDDALDAMVILDHLLVVAAALVGRAGLDGQADQLIDLLQPSVLFGRLEQLPVFLEESNVLHVLLQRPQRFVEPFLLAAHRQLQLAFLKRIRAG